MQRVSETARLVLQWLKKDDPFYIEAKIMELENTLAQMERDNDTGNSIAVMQQMDNRRIQLDILRTNMWNPPDLKNTVKS